MISKLSKFDLSKILKKGFAALQKSDLAAAEQCCRLILQNDPENSQGHFLVGLVSLESDNRKVAANAFDRVTKIDPQNIAAWAHLAKIFAELGYGWRAEQAISNVENLTTDNATVQNLIGMVYGLLGEYELARKWYDLAYNHADKQKPKDVAFGVNLANALNFLGRIGEAEMTLNEILSIQPDNPEAHWILAGLKKTGGAKHANQMKALAEKHASRPQAAAFLSYGAGKAYEDIGDWKKAFESFELGASQRRGTIRFDESEEVAFFEALHANYDAKWMKSAKSDVDSDAPIFIIGQPRTGTTLVERIIASHSKVISAGELQQVYLSIRRLGNIHTPGRHTADLAVKAAAISPTQLGRAYLAATAKHAKAAPHFVDKMPTNYLFAPLIARALPRAKIVHLVRGPMDSCFSSYKQLFAEAYLHSYDQEEMARHHVRYLKLMDQWRELLGNRMLEVSYEDTVTDLEGSARRIIEYLNLPWEQECLQFHTQDSAVATASAAQVREPAHTRSVNRWRKYEQQLQPMVEIMRANDVEI